MPRDSLGLTLERLAAARRRSTPARRIVGAVLGLGLAATISVYLARATNGSPAAIGSGAALLLLGALLAWLLAPAPAGAAEDDRLAAPPGRDRFPLPAGSRRRRRPCPPPGGGGAGQRSGGRAGRARGGGAGAPHKPRRRPGRPVGGTADR